MRLSRILTSWLMVLQFSQAFLFDIGRLVLESVGSVLPHITPATTLSQTQHYFRSASTLPPQFEFSGIPFVPCNKTVKAIASSLFYGAGGVRLVYAPPHAGKTTYITRAAYEGIKNGRRVEYYSAVRSKLHLLKLMGVSAPDCSVSDVVRKNTTIVIDQLDDAMTTDLRELVKHLAVDSYNTKKYNVVLSISDPALCADIVDLNGGQKITLIAQAPDFKWGPAEVDEYITNCPVFLTLGVEQKARLRTLALKAASPGFLSVIANAEDPATFLQDRGDWYASNHAEKWSCSMSSKW